MPAWIIDWRLLRANAISSENDKPVLTRKIGLESPSLSGNKGHENETATVRNFQTYGMDKVSMERDQAKPGASKRMIAASILNTVGAVKYR